MVGATRSIKQYADTSPTIRDVRVSLNSFLLELGHGNGNLIATRLKGMTTDGIVRLVSLLNSNNNEAKMRYVAHEIFRDQLEQLSKEESRIRETKEALIQTVIFAFQSEYSLDNGSFSMVKFGTDFDVIVKDKVGSSSDLPTEFEDTSKQQIQHPNPPWIRSRGCLGFGLGGVLDVY